MLMPSANAAAPEALNGGWMLLSIIYEPEPPATLDGAETKVAPNSRESLEKDSQKRLIGMTKNVLTAPDSS
jgi:hypothetical protein